MLDAIDRAIDHVNRVIEARYINHYSWLEKHLPTIFDIPELEIPGGWNANAGIITAHGDKAYGYRDEWEKYSIPFTHGVALYLMTYVQPFSRECREVPVQGTDDTEWVPPEKWVIRNYYRFAKHLPDATDGEAKSLHGEEA